MDKALWAQSGEQLTEPGDVGEGSSEWGTLELDLDGWVDGKEEIVCAEVKKRHEVVWLHQEALRSVSVSSQGWGVGRLGCQEVMWGRWPGTRSYKAEVNMKAYVRVHGWPL